ncbi:AMP-binding protein, partial [Microbacterium sp.]|uniref:AMP-binding protein n=2 Tax=Microbacterium TaxID=33882 RepID=UPI003F9AB193
MTKTSTATSTVPIHYSDLWDGIARAVPERLAAATADDEMSWGRFRDEAAALAAHLRSRGLRKGDAAATLLYNRTEFLVFMWACLAIGVAPVAINYRYRAGEVRDLLLDSSSRAFLVPTSLSALAVEAAAGLELEMITVDDGGDAVNGATDYRALLVGGHDLLPAPRGADMRLYTGGTTGRPR